MIAIIFVIRRHVYKNNWENEFYIDKAGDHNIKPNVFTHYNENIWGTERKSYLKKNSVCTNSLFFEILILLIVPIPYYDYYVKTIAKRKLVIYYFLSELLTCVMYLRIYFLIRNIGINSIYMSSYAKMVCRTYGIRADFWFYCKTIFEMNPKAVLFYLLAITIMVPAHILKIIETPFSKLETDDNLKNAFAYYMNSVWCTVITFTTVGYGDLSPCTLPGRIVLMIFAIWSAFVTSLLIAMLTNIIGLQSNE